jgi:hypothetical protein
MATAPKPFRQRSKPIEKPKPCRAKLRGLKTLDAVDGRTRGYIHAREVMGRLSSDLGGEPTEGQSRLVQRAAVLDAIIENDEANYLSGTTIDIGLYLAAVNAQRRVLISIGLDRRSRDVTPPSLADIAAEMAEEAERAADRDEAEDAA